MTIYSCRTRRLPLGPGLLALALCSSMAARAVAAPPEPLASPAPPATAPVSREGASYSLGLSFATQWREGGLDGLLSEPDLARGIHDGLTGSPLTTADQQNASAFLKQAYESWAGHNQAAAAEFLAHNAAQPGVKTTASGLQYVVMAPGNSKVAPAGSADHVTVEYRGRLLDGREFDSSYSRGKPAVIRPNDVIAGWREVLAMMNPGAEWRVFVPPDLAYALTPPPAIPPNSLLIFDIKVVDINPGTASRSSLPATAPK